MQYQEVDNMLVAKDRLAKCRFGLTHITAALWDGNNALKSEFKGYHKKAEVIWWSLLESCPIDKEITG